MSQLEMCNFSGEGEGRRKLDELRTVNVWWVLKIPYLFLTCILTQDLKMTENNLC